MDADNSDAQDFDEKYLMFANTVAFDLRGPLSYIKAYSDLLLVEEFGSLQESQREFSQEINRFVDKANNLLEMHQKHAIIESRILLVDQEKLDLASIINQIVNHLPELESNNQTLQVHTPDNLPHVKARFHEVADILYGLLEATIAQSLPGANISISTFVKTNFVKTTINTSIVKPSFENISEGRDIFIIKRYIEQFGGESGMESEEGKGSTIWFTLPIADESAET